MDISTLSLTLLGLFIALANAYTAFISYQTKMLALKIEVHTNSMKDALVKATQVAGEAKGREDMREEIKVEAKEVAKEATKVKLAKTVAA